MKKNEVEVGQLYHAKVSNAVVVVRITRESPYGGWDAVNTVTGRQVRIKTAARLRSAAHPTRAAQATERAALIAELGMAPEDGTLDGRYAATTGELARWAQEKRNA